ncbi:hypothetical protein SDRG_15189 [Saprolegnia diclina VS20]|uniref:Uncharacterized protein n=1 Tax=Saprolegnia diclina (strain VS20) TaxID=1156394 RepID=T0PNK6_SAPDV|nr:hypothetical protein SDRG_15189 [Saprolegnia diclina VS20]EQC26974.1 hypothetical protein SDRG_15189 [Saprolegnia diclina VS20]|eukprot:XP_008619576.1 hypothetical protein SDRG_15189 [Saprolegnia diclina VS20]
MWEEGLVAGDLVGLPVKLRARFYGDSTVGLHVLECPDEIGLGNMAFTEATYCDGPNGLKYVQFSANVSTPEFTIVLRLVGTYDTTHGLRGKWFNATNNLHGTGGFHFGVVDGDGPALDAISPLYPLAPGTYTFRGGAIGANGRVYASRITLQLLDEGRVEGYVQEHFVPQQCALAGSWTRNQISWHITYVVEGVGSEYVYYGTPTQRLLRGAWQRCDVDEIESLAAESGRFDYELEHADRRWCRKYHKYFPPTFQIVARTLLLSRRGRRSGLLPSDLWCHVFTYINYDWFASRVLDTP